MDMLDEGCRRQHFCEILVLAQSTQLSEILNYRLWSMRIENDKITDSIIMVCVFKGLCCVIVQLIVKLSPLGQSPRNTSSKVRTNPGR